MACAEALEAGASVKPLCIELFAGMSTWAAGWRDLGGHSIGFDIEHLPHHAPVPENCELVLQDVLTLHGSQFRNASLILASPPCQAYSYRAMPWKRAKALPPPSNALFEACFRIQREACEAAGRHIPMVVENVKAAQVFVGKAAWHFGSYYLWGDVPALMPLGFRANAENSIAPSTECTPVTATVRQSKNGISTHIPMEDHHNGTKQTGIQGRKWFDKGAAAYGSKSLARKMASAMIARIPYDLSLHIAQVYFPREARHPSGTAPLVANARRPVA